MYQYEQDKHRKISCHKIGRGAVTASDNADDNQVYLPTCLLLNWPKLLESSFKKCSVLKAKMEFVFATLPPANSSNSRCTPLLNDTDLSDGRIPVILGMSTVVWLVRHLYVYWNYMYLWKVCIVRYMVVHICRKKKTLIPGKKLHCDFDHCCKVLALASNAKDSCTDFLLQILHIISSSSSTYLHALLQVSMGPPPFHIQRKGHIILALYHATEIVS